MLLRDAADISRRVVPPLLMKQERLMHEIVRPSLPFVVGKTLVEWQRLDAAFGFATLHRAAVGIIGEANRLANRLIHQLNAFARCVGKVGCPIQIGMGQRCR